MIKDFEGTEIAELLARAAWYRSWAEVTASLLERNKRLTLAAHFEKMAAEKQYARHTGKTALADSLA